ncbi:HAD-IA family hydrolase [Nocardia sp. NRRL S-836]|uniref:HAD-IA family hydrolase n=1 Tax=Nocardia sp. NRRL S-836 TaxID=1519492 RepID=UPI0006AEBE13|nr:HAD-IA family hydrolase [Nocardia sp. NRRL S-836]
MFEAVLFDMDGVLVDTEASVADFWQDLARSHGFAISAEDLDRHVYGRSALHTLRELFPMLPPDRYDEVYDLMRVDNETLHYSTIPGVLPLLGSLRAAGTPTALVTGAEPYKATAVLKQLGLRFDVTVTATDVEHGKPDPACYALAARRLGVPVERCVVFEDAVSGITSAVAAGATCVALAPPQRETDVREAGAAAVVRDFREVSFSGTALRTPERELPFVPNDLFVEPRDRWDAAVADTLVGRDEVLYRSHLVGADPALTREGGGNFSVKGITPDEHGEPTTVLWMSSWGCDGAVTTHEDFPVLRLDALLPALDGGPMDEREMVEHLVASGLTADQKRPGIETLTHAFIPAKHVDHCHPDAVIALTSFPGGREHAEEEFGEEAIWFDYRQFDVDVARELGRKIRANPKARFVLLANHGIFTWAATSEQCYRNSLEAVSRSTAALRRAITRPADLGGQVVAPAQNAEDVLVEVLPVLRKALDGAILHVDRSEQAVAFASSARGPELSQAGPGCPDHVVTAGHRPLVLAPGESMVDGIERHREWYDAAFERYISFPTAKRTGAPHVVVLPGIGVVSSGPDAAKARLCADHFGQTMTVIRAADAAGGYVTLTEQQSIADEYWPLIRMKPQLVPRDGRLAGKVVLVTGLDDDVAIGLAERLTAAAAHVAIAGRDHARIAAAVEDIQKQQGERRAVALPGNDPEREAVLAYGGFDVVVDTGTDPEALAHAVLSASTPLPATHDRQEA